MNPIRALVSGDKKRFIDDKYNLDLSYITPRIIAMAFPGEGICSIYRNKMEDVVNFLNEKHENHYFIINLSGQNYDKEKFSSKVVNYNCWVDHHSPPLNLLFIAVEKIHNFLLEDPKNVIVVHCNAGKGRTGTLICCYLLFSGKFKKVDDALDYYSLKRFNKGLGLTQASQKRYVKYFYELISKNKKIYFPYRRLLKKIEVNFIPNKRLETVRRMYNIYNRNRLIKTYTFDDSILPANYNKKNIPFTEDNFSKLIYGDITIELFDKQLFKEKKLGRVAFNTGFLEKDQNILIFKKQEMDPHEFVKKPHIKDEYEIILYFEKICDCDNTVNPNPCKECENSLYSEIPDYLYMNKVIDKFENDRELGKKLLFGEQKDDVDEILGNRETLKSPNTDRRTQLEIDKGENCDIF